MDYHRAARKYLSPAYKFRRLLVYLFTFVSCVTCGVATRISGVVSMHWTRTGTDCWVPMNWWTSSARLWDVTRRKHDSSLARRTSKKQTDEHTGKTCTAAYQDGRIIKYLLDIELMWRDESQTVCQLVRSEQRRVHRQVGVCRNVVGHVRLNSRHSRRRVVSDWTTDPRDSTWSVINWASFTCVISTCRL